MDPNRWINEKNYRSQIKVFKTYVRWNELDQQKFIMRSRMLNLNKAVRATLRR